MMNLQEILSTPQTAFMGTYTQPMSGTDAVNGVFQEAAVNDYRNYQAQQAQKNLIERARAEAVREDPTLNYVQRQLAQGLLGAKRAYAMAEANGNAAGMDAASKAAQGFRDQASSIGWNPSDYGSDVPLEVAMQNMANNNTRAVNNLLYGGMNPDDYYQQQYNDMVKFGVDRKLAEEEAQRKTEAYHRNRASNMLDSFYSYGVDDRGAITPNGVRILSMMASEDGTSPSEIASYISKMQPTPQQNWSFENSVLLSDKGMQQALQKMVLQNDLRKESDMFRARLQAETRNMERAEKQAYVYQHCLNLTGGDEAAAAQMASQILLGMGKGGSGSGKGTNASGKTEEPKMSASERKLFNAIRNNETNIESLLKAGNDPDKIAEAEKAIEGYRELYKKWNNDGADYDTMRLVEQRLKEYDDQINVNKSGGINYATSGPSGGFNGGEDIDEETFYSLPEEAQQQILEIYKALDDQALGNLPERRRENIRKIRGY